jgi:16S rRNA (uracil1498-N3)-methyltransferase
MQIFLAKILSQQKAALFEDEARHCVKVLRHQVGDEIHCIDGQGVYYLASITEAGPKKVELTLLDQQKGWGEPAGELTLAVSPLRLKDRFEWLVEKAVELGIHRIQPLRCARTEKYKAKVNPFRLETLIQTATKQCLRSRLPTLLPEQAFDDWIATQSGAYEAAFIARGDAPTPLSSQHEKVVAASRLCLLIGPEGDFTDEEYAAAQAAGFLPVHLGRTRLRTETAGLFALGQVKAIRGY